MSRMFRVLLIFDTSGAASRRTLRGIAQYSKLHGPWIFFREPPFYIASTFGVTRITKKLPNPDAWEVDGVIAHIPYTKQGRQVIPKDTPLVISPYASQELPDACNFVTDDDMIGKLAAEYFLKRNFRYFAFCGYKNMTWSQKREQNFAKELRKSKIELHTFTQSGLELINVDTKKKGRLLLGEWLRSLPKPLAVMACNDDRALDVCEACKLVTLHVPHDVAILGVDNDDLVCEFANPPLSSIAVNNERAGYEAAELLGQLMSGKSPTRKQIIAKPTHVVPRQSSDMFAVDDPDMAKALRFIQEHSISDIHVEDVVEAVPLSRRVLESRFRKIAGHSILSEIRRARVERIIQLLIETNLSISEIALKLSYTGIEHIARYFRRETGMSLVEYRKQFGQK